MRDLEPYWESASESPQTRDRGVWHRAGRQVVSLCWRVNRIMCFAAVLAIEIIAIPLSFVLMAVPQDWAYALDDVLHRTWHAVMERAE